MTEKDAIQISILEVIMEEIKRVCAEHKDIAKWSTSVAYHWTIKLNGMFDGIVFKHER